MKKYTLSLLLLLISFIGFAQKNQVNPAFGFDFNRLNAVYGLRLPIITNLATQPNTGSEPNKGSVAMYANAGDTSLVIWKNSGWSKITNNSDLPFIIPEMFGAKGDGITNDAAALNSAITSGNTNKLPVLLTKTYLIKNQVYLKNFPVIGQNGARIIIAPDFIFTEVITGRSTSCILNNDFNGTANAFGNTITIQGITITSLITGVSGASIIGLANIKSGIIKDCSITVNTGSTTLVTAIDIWATSKNIVIEKCNINYLLNSNGGGSIWIRNITNNGSLEANCNDNITIRDCNITHAGLDEPLAVYGVQGVSKNILIENVKVTALSSTKLHSVLVSCFPLDNGSGQGQYASVQNVRFSKCTFIDSYYTSHIMRIGQTGADADNICDNINVDNCVFISSKTVSETSFVVRNIKSLTGYVAITNSYIFSDPTAAFGATNGIDGFDKVDNCFVNGAFTYAVSNVGILQNSTIYNIAGHGSLNGNFITNNKIECSLSPILMQTTNYVSDIRDNYLHSISTISLAASVVYIQSIASQSPSIMLRNNRLRAEYIGTFAIRKEGTGSVICTNNIFTSTGTGFTFNIVGTNNYFTTLSGNSWQGFSDDKRNTPYIANYNAAVPLGQIVYNSDQTLPNYMAIKIANNGNSTDWMDVSRNLTTTATIDFGSVSANSQVAAPSTVTLTGAIVGDAVNVTAPNTDGITYKATATSANTITVYACNFTTSSIDPASGTFKFVILR